MNFIRPTFVETNSGFKRTLHLEDLDEEDDDDDELLEKIDQPLRWENTINLKHYNNLL